MAQKNRISDILPGICVSLALSFLLFIYAPLELYSANKKEMWFDAYQMLPFMLVFFGVLLGTSVLLFVLIRRISLSLYKAAVALYFIVYICTYVQGNFLVSNLPPLDGTLTIPIPIEIKDEIIDF